jgi:hypothetical protein
MVGLFALILLKIPYFSEVRPVIPWVLLPLLGFSAGGWVIFLFVILKSGKPSCVALAALPMLGSLLGASLAAYLHRVRKEAR